MTDKSKAVQHLSSINVNDEYGTPQDLFEDACKKYNLELDIDYAASETNHVLENYFTKQNDAFNFGWIKDGYLNAPYSKQKEFMHKAYDSHLKHNINILILAYAKTDTKWWHNYVEGIAEVHFIKGRIKFNDSNGVKTKNSAPYPSCWIIYRRKK